MSVIGSCTIVAVEGDDPEHLHSPVMLGFGSPHIKMAGAEAMPLWRSWWAKGRGLPSRQLVPAETLWEFELIEVGMPAIAAQGLGRKSQCVRQIIWAKRSLLPWRRQIDAAADGRDACPPRHG
jgi:hypothetical protein